MHGLYESEKTFEDLEPLRGIVKFSVHEYLQY